MKGILWEILITTALTAGCTVFLPLFFLLKYNKYARHFWFSFFFERVVKVLLEDKMSTIREKTFQLLHKNLRNRDASKPLKILEIGIGAGSNLKFYPENSRLTALDVNATFEAYLLTNLKKFPNIVYDKTIIAMAEDMKEVEDCSFDLVVSTYVSCSVSSVQKVLGEVKRVLKPGGKYLFMEHVSFPQSDWRFILQQIANPVWTVYGNGCCVIRNTGQDIRNAGFSDVICERVFFKYMPVLVRPHIYGLATK